MPRKTRQPKVEKFTVQCGREELSTLAKVAKALDPVRPNRSAAARHLFRLGLAKYEEIQEAQAR